MADDTDQQAPAVIHSIKGFTSDLTCRGHQFEVGKTYSLDGTIKACAHGWHACTVEAHPFEVFGYYAPAGSRFFEVTQGGATDSDDNIKIASATITIGLEISIGDLVKRAWDYVWSRATKADDAHVTIENGAASSTGTRGAASSTGDYGAASSTGDYGAASSTGDYGAASSTGTRGAASSTGYQGAASSTGTRGAASSTGDYGAASSTGTRGAASSTGDYGAASSTGTRGAASSTGTRGAASSTGDYGAASSTGYQGAASSTGYQGAASSTGTRGAASSTGKQSAAMASGYAGSVKGADGVALFAVERDEDYNIVSVVAGIVGRDGIAADTWYVCKDGKLVEKSA